MYVIRLILFYHIIFCYILKSTFSPGLRYLLTGIFLDVWPFRLGSILLNTDFIFQANINSAGDIPDLVLGFGVILKTFRNCYNFFSCDSSPSDFLRALLNVLTKRSAFPFDFGWYGGVAICCISKDLLKNLNSLDVNCVTLSDTIVRQTLQKISCKKFIATVVVSFLLFIFPATLYNCRPPPDNILYLTAQRTLEVNGVTQSPFLAKA